MSLHAPVELQCSLISAALCPPTLILLLGFKTPARCTHKYQHFNVVWKIITQSSNLYSHVQRHWSQQSAGVTGNSRSKHLIKKITWVWSRNCWAPVAILLSARPSFFAANSNSPLGDVCFTVLCHYKCVLINVLWKSVPSHQISVTRLEGQPGHIRFLTSAFFPDRKHQWPLKL